MVSSVMYRARWTAHSSFCSRRIAPISRMTAASLEKMPTTSVRRLISPLRRSIGLVVQLRPMCGGEAHVGEHVGFGFVHQRGDLAPLRARRRSVVLGEGGGDEGGNDAPAALARMGEGVAQEVNPAALPTGVHDFRDRRLDALVGVGDDELDPAQAAPPELAQELGSEGLGLRGADVHAEHLAAAIGVDAHGDDRRQ